MWLFLFCYSTVNTFRVHKSTTWLKSTTTRQWVFFNLSLDEMTEIKYFFEIYAIYLVRRVSYTPGYFLLVWQTAQFTMILLCSFDLHQKIGWWSTLSLAKMGMSLALQVFTVVTNQIIEKWGISSFFWSNLTNIFVNGKQTKWFGPSLTSL